MPYRAPELFDVPSDATIDERTDVFSLGATLYATAFYYSPFECTYQDNTQRVVECSHLRVIGGAQFPTTSEYAATCPLPSALPLAAHGPCQRECPPRAPLRCQPRLHRLARRSRLTCVRGGVAGTRPGLWTSSSGC